MVRSYTGGKPIEPTSEPMMTTAEAMRRGGAGGALLYALHPILTSPDAANNAAVFGGIVGALIAGYLLGALTGWLCTLPGAIPRTPTTGAAVFVVGGLTPYVLRLLVYAAMKP